MSTVKYVGHKIGCGTNEADRAKLAAIVDIQSQKASSIIHWNG